MILLQENYKILITSSLQRFLRNNTKSTGNISKNRQVGVHKTKKNTSAQQRKHSKEWRIFANRLFCLFVELLSHVQLFATPLIVVSSAHGTFQARILEWVAISFSKGSSWLRDQTHISCIGKRILYHWAIREVGLMYKIGNSYNSTAKHSPEPNLKMGFKLNWTDILNRNWTDISSKKTCGWPIGMWKGAQYH